MIFAAPEPVIRFITGITSFGPQPAPEDADSQASRAIVRVKMSDDLDSAWQDLGVRTTEEAVELLHAPERDTGLMVEIVPYIEGDTQAFDQSRRQYAHIKSTHNDPKPKIFLCGSATPKRFRVGVANYNRFAVLRRVQISASSDFANPMTEDFYFDWPGFRLPAPIPNEFLITRDATTDGEVLYVRVAHSHTLQSPLSQENPLGGYPVYIYGRRIDLGPWSATLTVDWPEEKVQTGIETPNGIASFTTDYSGFQTGIGLKVIHPGATEFVEESLFATPLLDATINFVIDGGGAVIATGSKGYIVVDFNCEIRNVVLLTDQTGDMVADIRKANYGGFPTTASICASAKPTLVAGRKFKDDTLTGWTRAINAGEILEVVVDSAADVERATLALKVRRT